MRMVPLFTLVFLAACSSGEPEPEPGPVEGAYLNWASDATYVGKAVCANCHTANHETFAKAQMGRSFKPATASLSDADWRNPEPVHDQDRDLFYQPVRRGEELFVREFRLSGGDTTHVREERIDYIVGSGQHTNSHIREENGYLYQLPLTWYAQTAEWGLPPGFDGGDSFRFNRPVTEQCMACHDGPSDYAPVSENRFSNVPHGIECENCHGPGSVHVDAIQSGRIAHVATDIDYTIVNPAKLSLERQDDVCLRCHMQGAAVLKDELAASAFRPGQKLTDFMDVFWPRFPDSTSRFIMASHPDRLRMSACWQASREPDSGVEPVTCLTCHDPHQPLEAVTPEQFNAPCANCHEARGVGLCTEAVEVRMAVQNDCSSCHMPKSGTIDIPKVRVTDHFIRVPEPVRSDAGRNAAEQSNLIRMASLLRPDVDAATMASAYLTFFEEFAHRPFYLDSARAVLGRMPSGEALKQRVRLAFLAEDSADLVRLGSGMDPQKESDAWTAYRVGEGFLGLGDAAAAVRWLERATSLGPDHLRFLDKLGTSYMAEGRLGEAEAAFQRVLERDPTFATAWNNRGFLRVNLGDFEAAEADFREAISLDPDLPEALGNMASLLLNTGRPADAVPFAFQLLNLAPENPQYRQFWLAVSQAASSG
jgi:lipoprotein NlpI